jgi:NADPH:quinone reductase-like Zn-dependent oxidoreductase
VLRLEDVAAPAPGPGEVLVRVRAAGVDRGVWHLVTGLPYVARLAFGLRRPRRRIPGSEVAGRVEAVGEGVTAFRPGDDVFGACRGSFAELACAAERMLAPKPAGLAYEDAAALPVSGCTALQALRDAAQVRAGQGVLVVGAGGGVGTLAVQLAKALGAAVTGVCSAGKVDLVRGLGADDVLDYAREDFADGRRRWDAIVDTAGNRPLSTLRRALAPRGALVLVGGEGGGRWLGGVERQLGALLLRPVARQRLRPMLAALRAEDLRVLAELAAAGKLRPVVSRTYPLAEAPDAVRALDGHTRGKLVVTV